MLMVSTFIIGQGRNTAETFHFKHKNVKEKLTEVTKVWAIHPTADILVWKKEVE